MNDEPKYLNSKTDKSNSSWSPISFSHLASKELRETLRDRRTIVTLFLMPLLVYPILSLLFQGFIAGGLPTPTAKESDQFLFIFDSEDDFKLVAEDLQIGFRDYQQLEVARQQTRQFESEQGDRPPLQDLFEVHIFQSRANNTPLSLGEIVEFGEADVGIEVQRDAISRGRLTSAKLTLIYREDSVRGVEAAQFLERILDARNFGSLRRQISRLGSRPFQPTTRSEKVIPAQPKRGISFAALVPLILTLMTITGAVYPAIDLTAGERERGTLESLIAAPIPRMRILLGKLVAIVAVAMLTALLNLIGMMVTIWVFQLDTVLFGEQGLTWLMIVQILGLLVLFAAFFASVLLVITSFARSFKEGQAYLIPVMLVALAPSLMSLKPDLQLTGFWAITPLVNIVLLARDVLQGNANWSMAIVTVVSTIFYAALAITIAARFFGTAKVLYGDSEGISTLFRRPKGSHAEASASLAMLCLALLFPASFIWQGVLARTLSSASDAGAQQTPADVAAQSTDLIQLQSLLAALGIIVVFFVVPFLLARFHRVQFLSGFRIRPSSPLSIAAAVLLGFGLGPLLMQAIASSGHWMEMLHAADHDSKSTLVEQAELQAAKLRTLPIWWVLTCFALVPAIFEELFFRGMLFQALRRTLSPWKTIWATAVMFGAFHLITTSGLGINRLIPTTILGVILGWVCYRTGSVVPGMIFHGIHNSLALSFAYYRDELVTRDWITQDQSNVPLVFLVAGLILSLVGFALLMVQKKPDTS